MFAKGRQRQGEREREAERDLAARARIWRLGGGRAGASNGFLSLGNAKRQAARGSRASNKKTPSDDRRTGERETRATDEHWQRSAAVRDRHRGRRVRTGECKCTGRRTVYQPGAHGQVQADLACAFHSNAIGPIVSEKLYSNINWTLSRKRLERQSNGERKCN